MRYSIQNDSNQREVQTRLVMDNDNDVVLQLKETGGWVNVLYLCSGDGDVNTIEISEDDRASLPSISMDGSSITVHR